MVQSQIFIKEFYHKHSKEVRISARVLKIISLIPRWIRGLKVLDVGCGNGFITQCMSIYTDVKGIDIEDDIAVYKDDKQYDVVTCLDVLEHVRELSKALDNIKSLCKDGGLIIINQPEQRDKKQPLDFIVPVEVLFDLGKLIYLENYVFGSKESYNFMVLMK